MLLNFAYREQIFSNAVCTNIGMQNMFALEMLITEAEYEDETRN